MKKPFLATSIALVVVGLIFSIVWEGGMVRSLRIENAELRARAAEMELLRAENSRLTRLQSDPAELERLRSAQSELLRLRGEVTQLRQQLKDKQVASTRPSLSATPPKETVSTTVDQPVPPVETYVATAQAAVGPQQTLITGGWKLPSGKRRAQADHGWITTDHDSITTPIFKTP